ncbi:MAG: polysulfide reductase NrfD [Deltaproteobacteria bacterium]|nr:polysulfide reductase NrfD [Deltaproteobacteria bacterium]
MFEKALTGSKTYWSWVIFLLVLIGAGFMTYMYQYTVGLRVTGMSRDVSWALYISQLTFLVGVAASAVMLVLPYYLHNFKAYGRITILGEFLAVSSVTMCLLFVMVDLGNPTRLFNVVLHPSPNSILFWDMIVLNGYLFLNIIIGWTVLEAEKKAVPVPKWTKFLIYVSIPWAVSIHTVTAFLYAGLPGRHMWLTAVMAPRFLASAFAGGPALLIILAMIVRRFTGFDAGKVAIQQMAKTVTYALIINMFLFGMEFFTAFYSNIPGHAHSLVYLFAGLHGQGVLVPWMWVSVLMGFTAIFLLLFPATRQNEKILFVTAILTFASLWIDKGLGLVIGGFIPNPLEHVTEYVPTAPELMITLGVYGIGFLILTLLYKVAIEVKKESEAGRAMSAH